MEIFPDYIIFKISYTVLNIESKIVQMASKTLHDPSTA